MKALPLISEQEDLAGKRVLLRVDLNVPLEAGEVRDAYRIEQSIPTIDLLRNKGARVVLLAHIGKGKPEDTLGPVAKWLNKKFPLTFLDRLTSPENVRVINAMHDGDVVLLENLRHDPGEEKNDPSFASYLASLGDIYVNDAFGVSHRAHASVVGITALLPSYAGLLLAEEVKQLAAAFTPGHPFLFILGGAKISTKMPLLKKFLNVADHVFVGGVAANDFLKVCGHEVGRSVIDLAELDGIKSYSAHERLILPSDVVVKNEAGAEVRGVDGVAEGDMIVDVGTKTIQGLEEIVARAALIVWNGPLGYYEAGYTEGTRELLSLIANSRATSIIGGGDTVALINEMGFSDRFSFVSTGGGAMLDYLANETLPGIDALTKPK
ncbi:MAG: phosphoglycerate kinase [Candidatus Lloydbacteria bacterium RIFCSPLOWO2_01_FULL_50_20]|uniref:Phosphoglycerate kinase n=1 Tax=Candidatus Lloydbacteria bacterium RIFCSPLOWO2_01_FULL_50_20 TaxID=1798665 RepID=A0A1G2DM12_9BACT|nr:MAG: phosphoglycerate kinase [Candidatus Lloydbacteria bacterium RIFCSPHIGHO2_02_FULL_50_11]OGZ13868.1 MAG: phosphoglycerate kinase [Candidatus Lloydbacteria bacterium RIFCSPLOWO2_01_FULL_50_20]